MRHYRWCYFFEMTLQPPVLNLTDTTLSPHDALPIWASRCGSSTRTTRRSAPSRSAAASSIWTSSCAADRVPRESSPRHAAITASPSASPHGGMARSEEHTSELQSLMRISYAVFCLEKTQYRTQHTRQIHTIIR